jgi:hypothetical protein
MVTFPLSRNGRHTTTMGITIVVQNQSIRTDWINKIQRGKEANGTLTCTIWLSVGPVGFYDFKGKDAQTALTLLANHPALCA